MYGLEFSVTALIVGGLVLWQAGFLYRPKTTGGDVEGSRVGKTIRHTTLHNA